MRFRPPLTFAVALVLLALAIAGCGDDSTDSTAPTPSAATSGASEPVSAETGTAEPTEITSDGGKSGDARDDVPTAEEALAAGLDACLAGAKNLADETQRASATAQCKTSYAQAREAAKRSREAAEKAR
ncbi:MAG: hypothetical protein WAO61_05205 [Solirubrobacterales bacterium]